LIFGILGSLSALNNLAKVQESIESGLLNQAAFKAALNNFLTHLLLGWLVWSFLIFIVLTIYNLIGKRLFFSISIILLLAAFGFYLVNNYPIFQNTPSSSEKIVSTQERSNLKILSIRTQPTPTSKPKITPLPTISPDKSKSSPPLTLSDSAKRWLDKRNQEDPYSGCLDASIYRVGYHVPGNQACLRGIVESVELNSEFKLTFKKGNIWVFSDEFGYSDVQAGQCVIAFGVINNLEGEQVLKLGEHKSGRLLVLCP
jgi:hypothetical protein